MPQPTSYNTGNTVSGSIQDNNIAYVVDGQGRDFRGGFGGLSWMSEAQSNGNVIFIGNTTSVGRGPAGKPLFYPSATDSDADIIAAVNNLPGSPGNFTTTGSAYEWAVKNDFFTSKEPVGRFFGDSLNYYVNGSQPGSYPKTGTLWYDLSGRSANGSLINGPTFVTSGVKGAIRFDGTNDKVQTNSTPTSLLGDPPLTVCAVVKRLEASVNTSGVWGIGGNITNEGINCWNYNNTNEITIDTWSTSTFTSGVTYPQNRYIFAAWQKVPGNMTRANCTIWRNNVSYTGGQLTVLRPEGGAPNYNSQGITLGSISTSTSYCVNFDVSDFKVYDKVLTEDELLQVYYNYKLPAFDSMAYHWDVNHLVCYESGSTSTYDLTQETTGTLVNGVAYSSINGGVWDFDGTDDYIGVGNLDYINTGTANQYTTHVWVRFDSINTQQFFFGDETSGNEGVMMQLSSAGVYQTFVGGSYRNSTFSPKQNEWYLITQVQDSVGIKLYVNGEFQSTMVSGIFQQNTSNPTYIGRFASNSRFFNGQIGMISVYNRALTIGEIQQYYQETQ